VYLLERLGRGQLETDVHALNRERERERKWARDRDIVIKKKSAGLEWQ